MSADRLLALVPPPAVPAEHDLDGAPARLGVQLPSGYRDLARAYGPGYFGDDDHFWCQLQFYVPGARRLVDLHAENEEWTDVNRLRLSDPDEAEGWTYPLWPEPGGLLAWGYWGERATMWWKTGGDPDRWPTVIEDWEELATVEIDAPAEQVIHDLLTNRLEIPFLGPFDGEHVFVLPPAAPAADSAGGGLVQGAASAAGGLLKRWLRRD